MPRAPGWAIREEAPGIATGTTSLTLNRPSGTVDNDILVMALSHRSAAYATLPAGWTLAGQEISGAVRGEVYWRRASSEPATYSITGLDTAACGTIVGYSGGLAAGDVVEAVSVRANPGAAYPDGQAGAPEITTLSDRALLIGVACNSANFTPFSISAMDVAQLPLLRFKDEDLRSFARHTTGGTSTGGGVHVTVQDAIKVVPGACGETRYQNNYVTPNVAFFLALTPDTTTSTSGTRYYLTTRSPIAGHVPGPLQGTWGSTAVSPRNYGEQHRTRLLDQVKSDAGKASSLYMTRGGGLVSVAGDDCLWGRWATPPLDAQTIGGTLDVMLACWAGWIEGTTPGSATARYKVHAYIAVGQSMDVRHTLLDAYVDPTDFQTSGPNWTNHVGARWQGLTAPQTLTSGACQAGDSVIVEIGAHIQTSTTPLSTTLPASNYVQITMSYGATWQTSGPTAPPGVQDGVAGSTNLNAASFVEFSATLAEQAYGGSIPTNISTATATVIGATPFTDTLDTSHVPNAQRRVYYTLPVTRTGRVFVNLFGTNYRGELRYETSASSGTWSYFYFNDRFPITSMLTYLTDVTDGAVVTFSICVGYGAVQDHTPSGGGYLQIEVAYEEPLEDNDVIVAAGGWIGRYRGSDAQLVGVMSYNALFTGLAIDYSGIALADQNAPDYPALTNAKPKLLAGLFDDQAITILELDTLMANNGQYAGDVDYIDEALWADPAQDGWFPASLAATRDGTIYLGWFGNGFQRIADGAASYQDEIAGGNTARIVRTDITHGDNQPGAPWPAASIFDSALDAGGTNYVELNEDGSILYYTSGGWYVPIGGTTVKRLDTATGAQLPDFATGLAGSGPNPGTKGLFPIPAAYGGGLLVCNGSAVYRLDTNGAVVQTYTPSPAGLALSLCDVELTTDGQHFWAWDEESLTLFKFNLGTGAQVVSKWTQLGAYGSTTSLVVYRESAFPPAPVPPSPFEAPRRVIRRLRRSPHLANEDAWLYYETLTLDLESGVGLTDGQGEDPQVMLRWSDDGGHTWSDEVWTSAGRRGVYQWQAVFRRLGRSRDRVFEVVVSDPVRWVIVDAYLDVTAGAH